MLWKAANLTSSSSSHWFNGRNDADMDTCISIAPLLNVNPTWLFNEAEPMTLGVNPLQSRKGFTNAASQYKMTPVVGIASAGADRNFLHAQFSEGGLGLLDFPASGKDSYALRVEGDSMTPRIKPGEFIVIEPSHQPSPGDEVFVCLKDGRCMVKEYVYKRDGKVRLDSINKEHPPLHPGEAEIERMHFVSAIVKSPKFHEVISSI